MAEEKTTMSVSMQLLLGLKLNEVVELPLDSYDNIMSSTRYRARRKFGIIIKREGDIDYKKRSFKIKRVS